MKIGHIVWNSTSFASLGVFVTGKDVENAAEPDVTVYQIAGRNGDFAVSNNRWKNIMITYPAFIPASSATNMQTLRNALKREWEYGRLEDTYDSTHYRLARPVGELQFDIVRPNGAEFEFVFDCYPQRFLKSGDTQLTFTSNSCTTNNPTDFDAKPQIFIGSFTSGTEIEVYNDATGETTVMTATTSYADTVVIDCEKQDIYDESTWDNKNNIFEVAEFPVLTGGNNVITISGTATTAYVVPRWWEL